MHELGLTMEIVDIAVDRANGRDVRRLRVAIGKLAAVVPDSIRFCFELCAKGTVLERAELVLEEVPGRARCRQCGAEVALHRLYGVTCACGGDDLELTSGNDVVVVDLEVA